MVATARAGGGGGLRVGVGGGARRAARSAGAAVADGAAGPRARSAASRSRGRRRTRRRIRLATGIVILPQRNPVVLAKQIASLDVLSGGRFTFGVGVGYLEPEFRAIGADFEHRGAVTDEYLDAMQHLWYDEHPEYHGEFADFAGVDAYPRPVQQPIPIVVGGHSGPAYRRAVARRARLVRLLDDTRGRRASVSSGCGPRPRRSSGPAALGPLEITVTPARPSDARARGGVRRARRRSPRPVPAADPRRCRADDRRRSRSRRSGRGRLSRAGRAGRRTGAPRYAEIETRSAPNTISPEKCSRAIAIHSSAASGPGVGTWCVSTSVPTPPRVAVCAACATVE